MAPDGTATGERDRTAVRAFAAPVVRRGVLVALGRNSWPWLHSLSDRWPCRRCRAPFSVWMSGAHDGVNVRLGKRPFRPDAWERFRTGRLEGGYHRGCVLCRVARFAVRFLARPPPPART
ncbi:MAG: hypothetical protein ACT4OI_00235 [Methanobacteriota archaeon]